MTPIFFESKYPKASKKGRKKNIRWSKIRFFDFLSFSTHDVIIYLYEKAFATEKDT